MPMNLSTIDDMALESRGNPIDTEISRQQVDDVRRSCGYQDSIRNEIILGNGNQQSDYQVD